MSRRFGRNQKRAAREREASLQEAIAMDRALLAQAVSERNLLRDAMDRASRILGQHHVALPPKTRGRHPHPLGGDFNAALMPRVTSPATPEPTDLSSRARIVRMTTLLGEVRRRGGFEDDVHFYATLDSGKVAYCIAAETLYRMPVDELTYRLAVEIGECCAEELVTNLRAQRAPHRSR